jgi:glucuronate isomerase
MQLANDEAQRFNHEYIGTEHMLLGLVKEGSGVAANVLNNLGVDLTKVRLEVEHIVQTGPDVVRLGRPPQTPRAKRAIEFAIEEARQLNHEYVGTEHLLLGLLLEEEGVAAQVLMNLGLTLYEVRAEILSLLAHGSEARTTERPVAPHSEDQFVAGVLTQEVLMRPDRAGEVARRTATITLESRLLDEIGKIPIFDPHSHINPNAPAARSLDEIIGYHYYTELSHSAGMDKANLAAEKSPAERVAAIAEWLPSLENTVQYSWLLEIARTFFDFRCDAITPDNIGDLFNTASVNAASPDWEHEVLERSGVVKVLLTNDFDDPLQGFDTNRYVPCLRTDDLVFRLSERSTVARLSRATNSEVGDANSLVAAIGWLFEHFTKHGAKACAISLPPDFEPLPVDRIDVDSSVRNVIAGKPLSAEENRAVNRFVFWTLASFCAQFRLPFDLMIGVNRRVYRGGVFQGQDLFDQRTSLIQYRELFNAFPQVTFPISVLTSSQNQELVSYAWIFPNVVTNGHWWYSNVPAYIEPDARARLTAVPVTKQIAYYSDAYKLEFILPKFNMYRRVLATILANDFVIGRGWSEERAIALARQILRENTQRIFGV